MITEIVCCGGFNLLKRHGSVTVCHIVTEIVGRTAWYHFTKTLRQFEGLTLVTEIVGGGGGDGGASIPVQ